MGFWDFLLGERPAEVQPGEMQELMMARARGEGGASAAELMLGRGLQSQISAGRSAAASSRGVSPGLAMRQAGRREAGAMQGVGQQMAILRAQEQAAAQQAAMRAELAQQMYNASRVRSGGMLGPLLSMGGQMGAAALGMPAAGAAAGAAAGGGYNTGFGRYGFTPSNIWGSSNPYGGSAGSPGDYGHADWM